MINPFKNAERITDVTDEVIAAYNSSRKHVTRRLEFYEADNITLWKPKETRSVAADGSVSVDGSRDERRQLSVNLLNVDGVFDHNPYGFWYDKIIKPYRGIYFWSESNRRYMHFEYKLGEFLIDKIDTEVDSRIVSVSGRDFAKKLLLDSFDEPTTFKAGQKLDDLVKTIATNGGISKFNLNSGSIVLNESAAFDADTKRMDAIKKVCEPHNIEVYFDHEGRLTTRRYKDPSSPVTVDFSVTVKNRISAKKSSSDANVFNSVRVVATSENSSVTGERFVALRENRNATSPTSVQRMGRRVKRYSSPLFASQQQVNEYADRLLANSMLEDFQLSFETIMVPWLEANSVIVCDDTDRPDSVPLRFLLTDFNLSLNPGPMSGTGKRIIKAEYTDGTRPPATRR